MADKVFSNRNNAGVNFEPSVIDRIAGAVRYAVTGEPPVWFGPLNPINPVAPPDEAGRQFDYQTGVNINYSQRTGEATTFYEMRALADNLDILRLVIETRKDQMSAIKWKIKLADSDAAPDQRCKDLAVFFKNPDGEHTWQDWLRMLLEDLFVLDAPTLYPRKNKGGGIYAFEPVDGSTIKRIIDGGGRTPLPPDIAYQQILKGLPAFDYTKDELVYKPRNPRTHKAYGYSPVEQIIMTVNIAIRRQLSQLSYYTNGSTPDLIFQTPAEWNPDQIRKFKAWWDEQLNGNLQKRRGAMFVPAGVTPVNTKDALLKDAYDEWLARVVCYCFSIPPTAFVKETNRATAGTQQQAAREEGLLPLMNWVEDLMNFLIVKYFGYTDIVFAWDTQVELDALAKAQVSQIYLQNGVMTDDEVRDKDLQMPPLTSDQRDQLAPPAQPATLLPVLPDGSPAPGSGAPPGKPKAGETDPKKAQRATLKKASAIKPINRNRRLIIKNQNSLEAAIKAAFVKTKMSALAAHAEKAASASITKVSDKQDDYFDLSILKNLQNDFEDSFNSVVIDGVDVAFIQINYENDPDTAASIDQANEKAIEYARSRAAEMVGKRVLEDGTLTDNPNANWSITESTRDRIRDLVTKAEQEGWSNAQLADQIDENGALGAARAEMIARTETRIADTAGNMIAYRESGVVEMKAWILGEEACDECQGNADEGEIGIDESFSDGSDCAPAHPNCACDTVPRIALRSETDTENEE